MIICKEKLLRNNKPIMKSNFHDGFIISNQGDKLISIPPNSYVYLF